MHLILYTKMYDRKRRHDAFEPLWNKDKSMTRGYSCVSFIAVITFELITLYHTIPTFNNPEKEAAFSPFPTMFSTHPKKNFCFSVRFILSSTNAFNLDQFKNVSFGKEISHLPE